MRYFAKNFAAVIASVTVLLGGSALAGDSTGAGFLRFSASRTTQKDSHSIAVTVGLFARRANAGGWVEARDEDVWFQGVIDGSNYIGPPGQYRWTDGGSCPAAMAQLRKLRDVAMPKPLLPIPMAEEVDGGDIYLHGRTYTLDLDSANVNGQVVGAVSFSTNINSDLAGWVDGMLAALKPCWSRTAPRDMDPFRGRLDDALYQQRNPR